MLTNQKSQRLGESDFLPGKRSVGGTFLIGGVSFFTVTKREGHSTDRLVLGVESRLSPYS